MDCRHAVHVRATAEQAFAVLADLDRWPSFMSALERVRRRGTCAGGILVELLERAGGRRDAAVYCVAFEAPSVMRAVQLWGTLRRCAVEWSIRPRPGGARIDILHRFELGWPVVGPWLDRAVVGPRVVAPIVARTLANFKLLVETGRSPKRAPVPA